MKRTRTSLRARRLEKGTALVELAIMLPLLLLLSLLVMEGGEMIRQHIVVNNAAREGARFSTLPENNGNLSGIKQVVTDYAATNGVTVPAAQVTVIQNDPVPGANGVLMNASRVTVQHPFTMLYVPKLPGAQVPTVTVLYGRAEFRNFY